MPDVSRVKALVHMHLGQAGWMHVYTLLHALRPSRLDACLHCVCATIGSLVPTV